MPLYEYQCTRCDHRFELLQRFSDKPRQRCPKCRGKVERLIGAPAIRFKGAGWYVTDYGKKGAKPDGDGTGSDAKGTDRSADGANAGGKKDGGGSGKATKGDASS